MELCLLLLLPVMLLLLPLSARLVSDMRSTRSIPIQVL
jgi:hypothetical protein